jgi:hypothetical protein
MSRTLFSLAGFQVIISGRFWVIAEAREAEVRLDFRAFALFSASSLALISEWGTAKRRFIKFVN